MPHMHRAVTLREDLFLEENKHGAPRVGPLFPQFGRSCEGHWSTLLSCASKGVCRWVCFLVSCTGLRCSGRAADMQQTVLTHGCVVLYLPTLVTRGRSLQPAAHECVCMWSGLCLGTLLPPYCSGRECASSGRCSPCLRLCASAGMSRPWTIYQTALWLLFSMTCWHSYCRRFVGGNPNPLGTKMIPFFFHFYMKIMRGHSSQCDHINPTLFEYNLHIKGLTRGNKELACKILYKLAKCVE